MPSPKCLENIRTEKPPYNVPCTDAFCVKTSFARGQHCSTRGLPMDTPVLSWDPDLSGGQACYCCCSCFTLDTPIEARPGQYVMIQNINAGDTILASGIDLKWKETKVKSRTGDMNISMVPGLYCVYYLLKGEKNSKYVIVTPDHLFLMNTSKTLKKVQHLIPGDKLTSNDGSIAEVQFVVQGEYNTSVQSIEMAGKLDPKTLEGHLINSNGIISADYAVQVYHETKNLDEKHIYSFSNPDSVYEVGSEEYSKNFASQKLIDFLEDEESWPKGFIPKRHNIINIPKKAQSFLTKKQEQDVLDNAEFNPYTNVVGRDDVERLFAFSQMHYPNLKCILDWHNKRPNAFAWSQANQNFLVVTGGLVRLKGLYLEGNSLIIAFLQAYYEGKKCKGFADYEAINNLRDLWPDSILAQLVPEAIKQVKWIFSFVSKENAKGDPNNLCDEPSLDCRIQTYWNSFSFLGIPDCALPNPEYLKLERAFANIDNSLVNVIFDDKLEVSSATNKSNYEFTPKVEITKAEIDPNNSKNVILSVSNLQAKSKYILSVGQVKSVHNTTLFPGDDSLIIKTP